MQERDADECNVRNGLEDKRETTEVMFSHPILTNQ